MASTNKLTFDTHNKITFYNQEKYDSYESALAADDTHSSSDCIDALSTDNTEASTFDISDTIDAFQRCIGGNKYAFGVVSQEGVFVALDVFSENYMSTGY